MKNSKAIFIGYLDTCSYFSSLCTGFRAIGCDAHLLHRGEAISVGWSADQLPAIPKFYYRAYKRFWKTRDLPRRSFQRLMATATILISQFTLLIWQILKTDAVILKSGESLFSNAFDIKVLRFFRKTIVFFYVGSDSRPPYLVGIHVPDDQMDLLFKNTHRIYNNLRKIEYLADIVVANPLSAQFHGRSICIAQLIGNTVDEPKLKPGFDHLRMNGSFDRKGRHRILHAPSMPGLKGSDRIQTAIEQLQQEGFLIDYVEISGRPQQEVMIELAKCDIVVDELYSDSYGGVFAVEACAFGKPVVVCGYGAAELERLLPTDAPVPTVFRHPDRLLDTLRILLVDQVAREEAGQKAKSYFEGARPEAVADRFLAVIDKRVSDSWYVNAQDLRYVEGVCGPAEIVADNIARYVGKFGSGALLLDDKPITKECLMRFAFAEYMFGKMRPVSDENDYVLSSSAKSQHQRIT